LWKRFALKAGAITPAMRWEILLAQAYAALAQPARSQRELRNALGRAVTGGHVRSFIDEGTPVRRLLQDQLEASTIQTSPTDALVVSLLDAFAAEAIADADALSVLQASESGQTTSFTPLTRTQIEILQMASAGLQNREIARRIGMTEGSVKWYMQQIFNKIGVRKRAGALERARSLGLLA
jgi:LuxR family maltose regulon positive regulatory protein